MRNYRVRLGLLAILGASLACAPLPSPGQTSSKAPAEKKAAAEPADTATVPKPAKAGPFNGKLAAIDKQAKTIVVGKRTFQITSETKIKKAGKPATLEDGVVGEPVSGYVKPIGDGKLVATMVNFGPKASTESTEKQKAAPTNEKQTK
jgi:hypothetical protein